MNDPVYLLDGYSLVYRAYFALIRAPLKAPDGRNTSAIFGFFRNILSLFESRKPGCFAVVMDPAGPTFRHEQYPEYKANREKAPDDLHAQVPEIEAILAAMGIPVLRMSGFEADDLIATIAVRCQKAGRECYIITGDKDLLQLVEGPVKVLKPDKVGLYREIDSAAVVDEWEVAPSLILDYLSLTGDSADNVPGVPGIGPKTAVSLLSAYGSLDGIYEHLSEIKSDSQRKKL